MDCNTTVPFIYTSWDCDVAICGDAWESVVWGLDESWYLSIDLKSVLVFEELLDS